MGFESREFLKETTMGKDVKVRCVAQSYDRRVCFAEVNGRDLSEMMVLEGLAFVSPTKWAYCKGEYGLKLTKYQEYAKAKKVGIWRLPNGGVRPWEYRHTNSH
jgi:endonuclease YncB( thermonuclease family)